MTHQLTFVAQGPCPVTHLYFYCCLQRLEIRVPPPQQISVSWHPERPHKRSMQWQTGTLGVFPLGCLSIRAVAQKIHVFLNNPSHYISKITKYWRQSMCPGRFRCPRQILTVFLDPVFPCFSVSKWQMETTVFEIVPVLNRSWNLTGCSVISGHLHSVKVHKLKVDASDTMLRLLF